MDFIEKGEDRPFDKSRREELLLQNILQWLNLDTERRETYCPMDWDCSRACRVMFPYRPIHLWGDIFERESYACPCSRLGLKFVEATARRVVNLVTPPKESA